MTLVLKAFHGLFDNPEIQLWHLADIVETITDSFASPYQGAFVVISMNAICYKNLNSIFRHLPSLVLKRVFKSGCHFYHLH
ncbi:hypothetical protein D3C71_2078790 [compost metagenome]